MAYSNRIISDLTGTIGKKKRSRRNNYVADRVSIGEKTFVVKGKPLNSNLSKQDWGKLQTLYQGKKADTGNWTPEPKGIFLKPSDSAKLRFTAPEGVLARREGCPPPYSEDV